MVIARSDLSGYCVNMIIVGDKCSCNFYKTKNIQLKAVVEYRPAHLRSALLKASAAVLTTLKDNGRNLSMAPRIPSEPRSISERNFRPTLKRASRGHGWNQSGVSRASKGDWNVTTLAPALLSPSNENQSYSFITLERVCTVKYMFRENYAMHPPSFPKFRPRLLETRYRSLSKHYTSYTLEIKQLWWARNVNIGWCYPALTDDRTVDESREFFRAVSEVVADWRKRQYYVQVFPDKLDEVLPAVLPIWNEAFCLDFACHVVHLPKHTRMIGDSAVALCVVREIRRRHSRQREYSVRD